MVFPNDNFPHWGGYVNHKQLELNLGELPTQKLPMSADKAREPNYPTLAVILACKTEDARLFYFRRDPDKIFGPGWDLGKDGKRLGGDVKVSRASRLARLRGSWTERRPRKARIWCITKTSLNTL